MPTSVTPPRKTIRVELADGNEYALRLDFNALAEFEAATGKPVHAISENPGVREMRAILWASLLHKHPRLTIQQAGRLIPHDRIEAVMEACGEALAQAFGSTQAPQPQAGGGNGAADGADGDAAGEAEARPTGTTS